MVEEEGSTFIADIDGSDEACMLRPLEAAACTYRIAFGPRAGQKVLTLQSAMPRGEDFRQTLCADSNGFSLHTTVRCGADDRQALEQLCRYITRPAPANERVQTNAAGQLVLKLKTPWLDGTTQLVMSPLALLTLLIQRPLCGSQIRRGYVSNGSRAADPEEEVDASKPSSAQSARYVRTLRRSGVAPSAAGRRSGAAGDRPLPGVNYPELRSR